MAQDRVRAFVHGAQQLTRGPDHQAGIEARFPGHLTRRAQNPFLRVRIRTVAPAYTGCKQRLAHLNETRARQRLQEQPKGACKCNHPL